MHLALLVQGALVPCPTLLRAAVSVWGAKYASALRQAFVSELPWTVPVGELGL